MRILPPRDQIQKLVAMRGDHRGTAALSCPTLEQVEAAVAAGSAAALELTVLAEPEFSSVSVYARHAIVRKRVRFKRLTLTHISNLEVNEDGSFSFFGEVREYTSDWHEQLGRLVRGYSRDTYWIKYDPHLILWCVYEKRGGGHGTEYKDEI